MRTVPIFPNLFIIMRRYGFHLSISDGLANVPERAREIGCTSIQIFSGNPRAWHQKEFDTTDLAIFKQKMKEYDIQPVIVHMPYLPNLATPDKNLYAKSLATLTNVLNKAEQLNAEYVCMHIGKAMGSPLEKALNRVIKAINTALKKILHSESKSKTILLLENTAGQGTEIGNRFEHLESIINKIKDKKRIGVCLDTCHIFSAGYNLETEEDYKKTWSLFDKIVGMKLLKAIHLNDSKGKCGCKKDRHANIGTGEIPFSLFERIMNDKALATIPKILETPLEEKYKEEIRILKSLIKK